MELYRGLAQEKDEWIDLSTLASPQLNMWENNYCKAQKNINAFLRIANSLPPFQLSP